MRSGCPTDTKAKNQTQGAKRDQIQTHKVSAGHPRSNHLSGIQSSRTRPLKILPLTLTEEGRGRKEKVSGSCSCAIADREKTNDSVLMEEVR